jgi:hypothetical protein
MTYTADHPRYLCTCGDITIIDNDGMAIGETRTCLVCLDRFDRGDDGRITVTYKYPPIRKEA